MSVVIGLCAAIACMLAFAERPASGRLSALFGGSKGVSRAGLASQSASRSAPGLASRSVSSSGSRSASLSASRLVTPAMGHEAKTWASGKEPLPIATIVELLRAALAVGLPIPAALHRVADAIGPGGEPLQRVAASLQLGANHEAAWAYAPASLRPLGQVLALSAESGAECQTLLARTATDARRRGQQEAQVRAAKLSVQLMLPTGMCVLPAFLCLGVVPVVLGFVRDLGLWAT